MHEKKYFFLSSHILNPVAYMNISYMQSAKNIPSSSNSNFGKSIERNKERKEWMNMKPHAPKHSPKNITNYHRIQIPKRKKKLHLLKPKATSTHDLHFMTNINPVAVH